MQNIRDLLVSLSTYATNLIFGLFGFMFSGFFNALRNPKTLFKFILDTVISILLWIKFFLLNPGTLLITWLGFWIIMLYFVISNRGYLSAIKMIMNTMLNLMTPFGLPMPLLALFLMFFTYFIKMILDYAVSGIVYLFNRVKRAVLDAGKEIKDVAKKVEDGLKKTFKKIKLGDKLGSSSEEDTQELSELMSSTDELLGLLSSTGLID